MSQEQQNTQEEMDRRFVTALVLSVCVLISGAAVMIYEFVAVRFLQTDFGSLLDVWACEIAVCMAGLAFGYSLGGFLADRYRSWRVLGLVLVIAAVTALPMETLAARMGNWMLQRPQAWWHPLAAASSSFVPLLALGTVMPQAIRLHVRSLDRVGSGAGWIATMSTTGSIAGVLAVAMLLFPRYGVRETLWGTSAVLAVLGIVILAAATIKGRRSRAAAAALLLCGGAAPAQADVVFEKYSAYHHILVVDYAGRRELRFDDSRQTIMPLNDPFGGGFEYAEFFHTAVLLDPTVDSVLFIGLGGGTGPKSFFKDYPYMQIEAAEIDPMVVRVAKDFFALPEDKRISISTSDGRTHLRRSRQVYGAIFLDAYGVGRYGGAIPFHLATKEFFEIARDRLRNGGCLVYNVMGTYNSQRGPTVRGIKATLGQVFQAVYAFEAASSLNTVLVAQKIEPAKLDENGLRDGKAWPEGPWLNHPLPAGKFQAMAQDLLHLGILKQPGLAKRVTQFSPAQNAPDDGPIFTDNYAPVDITPGLHRAQ